MNPIHATKRSLACGAACIVVLSLLLTLGCGADTPAQASGSDENTNILRLHVIANSDTATDQAVKLKVRDAVLACVEPGGSAEETENFLLRHGKELQAAVETTLRDNGFSYGAQLMLGRYEFPDRSYAGTVYPAGEYKALRVVLGAGGGHNWWCVLFPPLCIVSDAETVETRPDGIRFESTILKWFQDWRKAS